MALDDNAGVGADDVQLSLKFYGRDQQQLETTRLNSRTLMFTAPSKQTVYMGEMTSHIYGRNTITLNCTV